MPPARARSSCDRRSFDFNELRISHTGTEPPASARRSLKARLTAFEVLAGWRPMGVCLGFIRLLTISMLTYDHDSISAVSLSAHRERHSLAWRGHGARAVVAPSRSRP